MHCNIVHSVILCIYTCSIQKIVDISTLSRTEHLTAQTRELGVHKSGASTSSCQRYVVYSLFTCVYYHKLLVLYIYIYIYVCISIMYYVCKFLNLYACKLY